VRSEEYSRQFQEFNDIHTKGSGKALDDVDGRVPAPSFNRADVGTVNAVLYGEFFLAQASLLPQSSDIRRQSQSNVHAIG